jgi:rubrerythrin
MLTMWEIVAMEMQETYGAMVDFDEKFFICPECGEPVYADDWEDTDFDGIKCPICEWCGD